MPLSPLTQDCVFFETALHLRRGPHMAVECVPVPEEAGETAPMYFQKAIQGRTRKRAIV